MRDIFNFKTFRYLTIFLVLILAISCSRSDPAETAVTPALVTAVTPAVETPTDSEPTSVPDPVATPTTVVHTVSPSSTAVAQLPMLEVSEIRFGDCRISGELGENGFSGSGTAPAPTSTPSPPIRSRTSDVVERELQGLSDEIGSVLGALMTYDRGFRSSWQLVKTDAEQAAQLHVYGNRLAQLCSAVSQSTIPPEAFGSMLGLSESIRARYAWVTIAADELECCGSAKVLSLEIGFVNTSTAIDRAVAGLTALFESNSVSGDVELFREVSLDRFPMTLTIPGGSIVVRNTIDVVVALTDTAEVLDPVSLGPESWDSGIALRIRRLRNRSEISVEQAVSEVQGIVARFGDPVESKDLEIPEFDEIQFSISSDDQSWKETTVVFVHDRHSYIVELMCIAGNDELCDLGRSSVESLRLTQ